jgi:hypothetical protein
VTAFVIDFRGMDPVRWTNAMALSLSQYGNVPKLGDAAQWRAWGSVVTSFPALAAIGAPRPERFASWEAWVRQFNLSLRLLT